MKEQGGQEAEEEMEDEGSGMMMLPFICSCIRSTWVDVLVGKEDGGSEAT